ncbi:MAG: hypothetical protein LOD92_08095, partial [Bacillales bacterium]
VQYIPFYEAVEFLDGVELVVQKKLEAALIDSGLLNALIMKDHIAMEHDRMIKPNPQLMAHTLADYLQPDVDDDADVPAEKIMEVLQSILVADNGAKETIVVKTDGTYQLGLLEGHAVPVDKVRYIGRTARRRHREEQITLLNTEIEQLKDEAADVRVEISRLKEKIDAAKQAIENFPNDEDLLAAYKEIEKYRFQIKQLEEDLMERDKIMHEKMNFFQKLRRELNSATRELNIEFSYEAYQEAVDIQRRYEKDLNELEKLHVKFRHQHENKKRTEERLQELAEEIDDLKGEVNISGAKNSAVAILPAAILAGETCTIKNLPDIKDVSNIIDILIQLGARVEREGHDKLIVNSNNIDTYKVDFELSKKLRASYYFIGALLGRFKKAEVPFPGGCDIG